MTRYSPLLLVLLLTACVPVTPSAPPVYVATAYVVLPNEAQRIIDAATATAGAQATQAARVTAEYQSTSAALAFRATQISLDNLQTQQADAATVTADARTAWARQTHAAETPTARAVAIAANQERGRANAEAEGRRGFWSLMSLLAVAAFVVLCASAYPFLREWLTAWRQIQTVRVEEAQYRSEMEKARALQAAIYLHRELPYLFRDGQLVPLLSTPELMDAPPVVRGPEWQWKAAAKKIIALGIELGAGGKPQFGERDYLFGGTPLITNGDGTPAHSGFRKLKRLLRECGAWATEGRDTVFAEGWTVDNYAARLDDTDLPYLPDGEPPDVRTPLHGHAVPQKFRSFAVPQSDETPAARAVVEG